MKLKSILLINLLLICLSCFSQNKVIELPLTIQNGFGPLITQVNMEVTHKENENDPFRNIWLKVSKFPEELTDIKYGNIISDMFQCIYQNYRSGNIPEDLYKKGNFHQAWKTIDTLTLSKTPIRTLAAFAYGKDSKGILKIAIDTDGDLDLNDEKLFTVLDINIARGIANQDSLMAANTIYIPFDMYIRNKVVPVNAPLFIVYDSKIDRFFGYLSLYATTQYKGVGIAVSPDNGLLYQAGIRVALTDNLKEGEWAKAGDILFKGGYIEIEDNIYKILGVNTNNHTLALEETALSKSRFYATQIGFKPQPFQGKEFTSKAPVSTESLKGKYVLLDFCATWCGPCRKELPNLKELYSKTDRAKLEIVGIVGDSSPSELTNMIKEYGITWPQILSDETNNITKAYGIGSYPTTILLDKEGIVIAKDLRGKELEDKILRLLNE